MSSKTATPPSDATPAAATPRTSFEIQAELDAAEAEFKVLEAQNRDYHQKRQNALTRRQRLEEAWKKEDSGVPFDETAYNPPATVPPADSPVGRQFHRHHYKIARLKADLETAKKTETSE